MGGWRQAAIRTLFRVEILTATPKDREAIKILLPVGVFITAHLQHDDGAIWLCRFEWKGMGLNRQSGGRPHSDKQD